MPNLLKFCADSTNFNTDTQMALRENDSNQANEYSNSSLINAPIEDLIESIPMSFGFDFSETTGVSSNQLAPNNSSDQVILERPVVRSDGIQRNASNIPRDILPQTVLDR